MFIVAFFFSSFSYAMQDAFSLGDIVKIKKDVNESVVIFSVKLKNGKTVQAMKYYDEISGKEEIRCTLHKKKSKAEKTNTTIEPAYMDYKIIAKSYFNLLQNYYSDESKK